MSDLLTLPPMTLVLGGIRSGKSAYAEKLIESAGGGLYLATAEARDDEMKARIQRHRERRGPLWETVEEPLDLVTVIHKAKRPVLIDCVTIWLNNLVEAQADVAVQVKKLGAELLQPPVPVVLVTNEVGLGGISDNAAARAFADLQGASNQIFAEVARRVVFVAAGLPMTLKDMSQA
ncbi:bifunctional adenosylcobinamide kinase/adenosylcobinamide-phosphate guanylyltransferase [Magnetospira sp. QH-2]|uniref:bifunctional adenosylcobinamide kinase/adenosylcobinamide-phosphate guanylyltransferase n=1 Tax=Magnetospira sp. (strain QH-2) TaxID=1288970 RepID=UPI0003E80AF2|nr:bifunctional adenosylcobinamide kinase/adenosylcobinamide-phosphate guanylyltransferase [Magnetospira sp. QH-2]CCQ72040.1 adenosylcobinamide kinase/adenosylcobinamide-phosphate guanylyltransferase [Magnetospira sp. QH-2]